MTDLDELMELYKDATPGPYATLDDYHVRIYAYPFDDHAIARTYGPELNGIGYASMTGDNQKNNAAYICAACNAVPKLVKRIKELEKQLREIKQAKED